MLHHNFRSYLIRYIMQFTLLFSLIGFGCSAQASQMPRPSEFKVIKRIKIGGTGGWDYLHFDSKDRHLFVSHGNRVLVIDVDQNKVIDTIKGTKGVHGIALAPGRNLGFTSNGKSASVTMFDLETLKRLGTISGTGKDPDAILYDRASGHVFTFNGRSDSASVIDPARRAVVATIPLPGKPEFAAADGQGHIFDNIESTSELVEINTATNKVTHTWTLAHCKSPSGLALDVLHQRVFSVCDNGVMAVTDASNGREVAAVPIGKGPDAARFDAGLQTVFSSNGDSGTLTAVHEDTPNHYTVTATIPTQVSARTQALDPKEHRVFLSAGILSNKRNPRGWRIPVPGSFTLLVVGAR